MEDVTTEIEDLLTKDTQSYQGKKVAESFGNCLSLNEFMCICVYLCSFVVRRFWRLADFKRMIRTAGLGAGLSDAALFHAV